jgi:hypothetical protein
MRDFMRDYLKMRDRVSVVQSNDLTFARGIIRICLHVPLIP